MYSYIRMESHAVREVSTPLRLPLVMPGGVVAAQGPLEPLTQVRILAGQPLFLFGLTTSVALILILTRLAFASTSPTDLTK